MDNFEFHTHLEGAAGHSHGDASSQVVEMPGHGVGRLRRALEAQGYDVHEARARDAHARSRPTARWSSLANPRTTFLPAESAALRRLSARRRLGAARCSISASCSSPSSRG